MVQSETSDPINFSWFITGEDRKNEQTQSVTKRIDAC